MIRMATGDGRRMMGDSEGSMPIRGGFLGRLQGTVSIINDLINFHITDDDGSSHNFAKSFICNII